MASAGGVTGVLMLGLYWLITALFGFYFKKLQYNLSFENMVRCGPVRSSAVISHSHCINSLKIVTHWYFCGKSDAVCVLAWMFFFHTVYRFILHVPGGLQVVHCAKFAMFYYLCLVCIDSVVCTFCIYSITLFCVFQRPVRLRTQGT